MKQNVIKKEMENKMLKLRAHHGLCIQFFQGKGYNKAFVKNMTKTIHSLKKESLVQIIDSCDVLCKCCPHNRNGECEHNNIVHSLDLQTLNSANVLPGTICTWKEYTDKILKIITSSKRKDICKGCEWSSICRQMEKFLIKSL